MKCYEIGKRKGKVNDKNLEELKKQSDIDNSEIEEILKKEKTLKC